MWQFFTPCVGRKGKKVDLREMFDVGGDKVVVDKGVGVSVLQCEQDGGGLERDAVAICGAEPGVLDEINGDGGFPVGGRWVGYGRGKVFYTARGDLEGADEVVVLLHGLAGYSYVWDQVTDMMLERPHKKRLLVVGIDFIGCGRSHTTTPHLPHDLTYHTDQVKAVYDALGLTSLLCTPLAPPGVRRVEVPPPKVTIGGVSLGAAVAVGFATTYPHLVDRLMLISPLGVEGCVPAAVRYLPSLPSAAAILAARIAFHHLHTTLHQASPPETLEITSSSIASTLQHFPLDSMRTHYTSLSRRKVKTLLMWGRCDEVNPYHLSTVVRSLLGAQCQFRPTETGHHLPLTHPGEVVAALVGLLTEPKKDL